MKIRLLFLFMVAAGVIGCSNEGVETPESPESVLEYRAALGRSLNTATRAAELTPDNITGETLTVKSYAVGTNTAPAGTFTLKCDNNGTWSYGAERFLHPVADLVHFSVHPTANIGELTAVNTADGTASFTYTVPATAAAQEDLIGEVTTSTKADPVARLTYKHLLSQINFSVVGEAGMAIQISDIKIGKLSNSATYTFDGKETTSGGTWGGYDGNATYDYLPEVEVGGQLGAGLPAGTTDGAAGEHFFGNHNTGGALDNSHSNALMLLPQPIANDDDAFFSFNYTITDKSTGTVIDSSGDTPVEVLLKSIPIGGEDPVWEQGKRYLYTIRFNERSGLGYSVDIGVFDGGGSGSTQPTVTINSGSASQTVWADAVTAAESVSFTTTGAWTSSIDEATASESAPLTRAATPNWISIDPTSGESAGDYTIAFTLQKNYTGEDRRAKITITSGTGTGAIFVTQKSTTEAGAVPVDPSLPTETVIEGYGQLYVIDGANGSKRVVAAKSDKSVLNTNVADPANLKLRYHSWGTTTPISFEFTLHDEIDYGWTLPATAKTFVISDLHGRLDAMVSALKNSGVIDNDLKWSWGTNQLIVLGDMLDRGANDCGVAWLTYKLEKEAYDAGGRVDLIAGNHEDFVLKNDLRYLDTDETSGHVAFASAAGIGYSTLWAANTELGKWIRNKNLVLTQGRNLFVHAGISPQLVAATYTLEEINTLGHQYVGVANTTRNNANTRNSILFNGTTNQLYGVIWDRGIPKETVSSTDLDAALAYFNVDRIIVGHTVVSEVSWLYDGRGVAINVEHKTNFQTTSRSAALLIEGDKFYKVSYLGVKTAFN